MKRFRSVIKQMVLETHSSTFFTGADGELKEVNKSRIIQISPIKEENLDAVFLLTYENGITERAPRQLYTIQCTQIGVCMKVLGRKCALQLMLL